MNGDITSAAFRQ